MEDILRSKRIGQEKKENCKATTTDGGHFEKEQRLGYIVIRSQSSSRKRNGRSLPWQRSGVVASCSFQILLGANSHYDPCHTTGSLVQSSVDTDCRFLFFPNRDFIIQSREDWCK